MSDSYPSWLPKRLPPPVPASTYQSSADPHPPAADVFATQGRKPSPRSIRIVAGTVPWREPTGDLAETRVPSQPRRVSRASLPPTPPLPRPRFRAPSLHLSLLHSPTWSMRKPSMSSMLEAYTCSACTVAHMPTWPCNKRMSSSSLVLGWTIAQRGKCIVSNSGPHSSTIQTDMLPAFAPAARTAAQQGRGGIIHFEIMPKNVNKVVDASIPVVGD